MGKSGKTPGWKRYIWLISGVLVGYILVIIGTSLIFYLLPGKGVLNQSSILELFFGGVLVLGLCFLAGVISSAISKTEDYLPAVLIAIFIISETIWLISEGNLVDPNWFVVLGGLNILAGLFLGNLFYLKKYSGT